MMSVSSTSSTDVFETSKAFSTKQSKEEYLIKHTTIITKNQLFLSRGIRIIIFLLFISLSIIVDVDNGVIASSSQSIKQDLNISDGQFGLFVSIPFTGRILGLLIFIGIISSNHRKLIMSLTVFLHGITFYSYSLTSNYYILILVRIFTAIMKVYGSIYMPVWIDQFGIRKYKTLLFTLSYMISPYGQVFGFYVGTIIFPGRWKNALYCIGTFLIILSVTFIVIPSKYFSTKYMFIGYEDKEKLVFTKNNSMNRVSLFAFDEKKIKNNKNSNKVIKVICNLIKNKIFIFSSLTRAIIFFTFQIIHNFFKDYALNGLKIKDEKQILYYYGFASILGPAIGSLLGGIICNKLGGYESKNSILVPIIFGILANISIFSLINITKFTLLSLSLCAFFFSSGAILPTIAGYIIFSVRKENKGIGSSFDMLLTTLLGKLPGPIFYGLLNDKLKNFDNRLAWKISLGYFYIGFIFMIFACFSVGNKPDRYSLRTPLFKRKKKKIKEKMFAEIGNNNVDLIFAEKPMPKLRVSDQQLEMKDENDII
jgi:MFS family permease